MLRPELPPTRMPAIVQVRLQLWILARCAEIPHIINTSRLIVVTIGIVKIKKPSRINASIVNRLLKLGNCLALNAGVGTFTYPS